MLCDAEVPILDRPVGGSNDVYVIAEAGVNHDGDPATAHALIEAAHRAGADAVKFQVFSADRLTRADAPNCSYQRDPEREDQGQRALLRRLELPSACMAELAVHARELGLHFLATPFGLEELEFLLKLGVAAVKIASPDLVNTPLLRAAARSGAPLILSAGASFLSEIDQAVELVREQQHDERLILLHCLSAYPTPLEEARLACVGTLARRYHLPTGFSDHTREYFTGSLAVAAGATILEKHLTLDRARSGPDHFFSLDPDGLSRYVASARSARRALGDGQITLCAGRMEVRRLARGSLATTATIRRADHFNGHYRHR